ncbi:MAG: leucine-rich repeat domain-containing protein [Rikenellaceae bacterium]
MKRLKFLCVLCCTLIATVSFAHDFSAESKNGQKFFFNIIDAKALIVEVTYEGSITSSKDSQYEGDIIVPVKVKYKDKIYTVKKIGAKAFSNAKFLTGIEISTEIETIGEFAFEKCENLRKVVFPGTKPAFGEGVFFGCTSINNISLGSDWTSVNLKMFMWSERLTSVTIPAKITAIQNMKSLKYLQEINVDVNNTKFVSIDGVLYNKNEDTLLGCPRDYVGHLKVYEGVRTIYYGALVDCPYIESVDFPETLESMSCFELSRMVNLSRVIMRNPYPISTATMRGKEVFALKVINKRKLQLVVPRLAVASYKGAICFESADYKALAEVPSSVKNVPIRVMYDELIDPGQIVGVKSFVKYE